MSSLAMADLLSHYLATGDERLVAIETVGEEVVKPSEGTYVMCSVVWCVYCVLYHVLSLSACSCAGIMTRSMRKKGMCLVSSMCAV